MSLGLIETRGLTATISAADAACKSASVEIIGYKKVGSGLVTVCFQGEVSAVQAAIENGVAAVRPADLVVSSLVIARPDSSVVKLLNQFGRKKGSMDVEKKPVAVKAPVEVAPVIEPVLASQPVEPPVVNHPVKDKKPEGKKSKK
ncbi:BMC domain-containing protein [Pragia fontium]